MERGHSRSSQKSLLSPSMGWGGGRGEIAGEGDHPAGWNT